MEHFKEKRLIKLMKKIESKNKTIGGKENVPPRKFEYFNRGPGKGELKEYIKKFYDSYLNRETEPIPNPEDFIFSKTGLVRSGENQEKVGDLVVKTEAELIKETANQVYKRIDDKIERLIKSGELRKIVENIYMKGGKADKFISEVVGLSRWEGYVLSQDEGIVERRNRINSSFKELELKDKKRLKELLNKGDEDRKEIPKILERGDYELTKILMEHYTVEGINMLEWNRSPMIVYPAEKTGMFYTDIKSLPEDIKDKVVPEIAFKGQSNRAYFIVENNKVKAEYKGLTPDLEKINKIIHASDQPEFLLLKEFGEREARALNDIADNGGKVRGKYWDVGRAILTFTNDKGGIKMSPLTEEQKKLYEEGKFVLAENQKIINYGVLERRGEEYIPFIRIGNLRMVQKLSEARGIELDKFLSQSLGRLGEGMRIGHNIGIYHCFPTPGNVDGNGNLIDYEASVRREKIPLMKEIISKYENEFKNNCYRELSVKDKDSQFKQDLEVFGEEGLKFRDIDVFFGGNREEIKGVCENYNLSREALRAKVLYPSLVDIVPPSDLNIGFYDLVLKRFPSDKKKKIIGAFVDNYHKNMDEDKRNLITEKIMEEILPKDEWTERATEFIVNPENKEGGVKKQLSGVFLRTFNKLPKNKLAHFIFL